jgi:hypothetical protein
MTSEKVKRREVFVEEGWSAPACWCELILSYKIAEASFRTLKNLSYGSPNGSTLLTVPERSRREGEHSTLPSPIKSKAFLKHKGRFFIA